MATITTDILQLIIEADQADAQEVLKNWRKSVDDAKVAQEALGAATEASTVKVSQLSPEISDANRVSNQFADTQKALGEAIRAASSASAEGAQSHEDLSAAVKEASTASGNAVAELPEQERAYNNIGRTIDSLVVKYLSLATILRLVVREFRNSVQQGTRDIQDLARLRAVIEITGKSSELSASQISKWASSLEQSFNVDKSSIMQAAAGLMTFENIDSSSIERIFQISTDLSYVWGSEIGTTIVNIGKVLEDPISNMDSLRRMGVLISTETKQVVTNLLEQNAKYEAQAVLLDEIQEKVSGVANTVANTNVGKWQQLGTTWKEFTREVGINFIAGIETGAFGWTGKLLKWASSQLAADTERITIGLLTESKNIQSDLANWSIDEIEKAITYLGERAPGAFWKQEGDYQDLKVALEGILILRHQEAEAAVATAAADKAREEAAKARRAMLEAEVSLADELRIAWVQTDEGRGKTLLEEIDRLSAQQKADKLLLETYRNDPSADLELVNIVKGRIGLYDAVIEARQAELDGLADLIDDSTENYITKILGGKDATEFSLSIPVSYDFGDRSESALMQEQLSVLRSKINEIWTAGPAEGDSGEWQNAIDALFVRYSDISGEMERQKTLANDQKGAKVELVKLLSDQEVAELALIEYAAVIAAYESEGLITAEQRAALYDLEVIRLGLVVEEARSLKDHFGEMGEALKEQFLTAEAMGERLSGIFFDIGSAMAAGKDGLDAIGDGLQSFASDILGQISSMAIAAGLRMIVELGVAGLPAAIGLFALGGVAGIGAGFFSSSGSGIDSSIMSSLNEELAVREKLNKQLQEQLDVEVDLLRRQLDRNLISVEDYLSGVTEIKGQRTFGDAQSDILSATRTKMTEIDAKLSSMSGWDKFWTNKDEKLESQSERIAALAAQVNTATADELRKIMQQLQSLGVDLSSVPKFASGGEFITNGPMLAMLGDNRSGREHVRITPVESHGSPAASPTIIINGGVWGIEDLYKKLAVAGIKIGDRNQ